MPWSREKINEYSRNWARKHPEYARRHAIRYFHRLRREAIEKLGGRCMNPKCAVPMGMRDIRALQIDISTEGGLKRSKLLGLTRYIKRSAMEKTWTSISSFVLTVTLSRDMSAVST